MNTPTTLKKIEEVIKEFEINGETHLISYKLMLKWKADKIATLEAIDKAWENWCQDTTDSPYKIIEKFKKSLGGEE